MYVFWLVCQSRLGKKVTSLKARQIQTMLKIYERMNLPEVISLIVRLDDEYGTGHCFSNIMTLDIVSSKTWLPRNIPAGNALLVWVSENLVSRKQCREG